MHQQLGACMRQQHHTLAFKGVDGIAVRLKKSAALLQRHAVGLGIEFWRDVKALIVAFHSRKALLCLLHALEHGIVGVKALGIFPVAERAVKRRFGIFQIALGAVYLAEGKTETAAEHKPDYLRKSQAEREREVAERQGEMDKLAAGIVVVEKK